MPQPFQSPSFQQQAPTPAATAARFPDLRPPFDRQAAIPEANRCLFCFDAPCMQACPTHIDVPRFIKKIASDNLHGSAQTILDANILGASCSRACPVEVLCEGACVLNHYNRKPIQIGSLQRYAMDAFHDAGSLPFEPAPDTGKRVALIGAGPASLACAAELRRHGHDAHLYDARPLPGGLNTYGIAEYKLTLAASLHEIDMIAALGVQFHPNTPVDEALLQTLAAEHDAIFLGVGLGAIHRLGIAGENLPSVTNALELVAGYKDGTITSSPARVAVVGAGNTAIDAAIAAVRLGAAEVTMLYRRDAAQMSAFTFEYDHARHEGVLFHWHVAPISIEATNALGAPGSTVSSSTLGSSPSSALNLKLQRLAPSEDGSLLPIPGSEFTLPVDQIVLAIGQSTHTGFLAQSALHLERGRIVIDRQTGQTSNPKFFAGGDCTNGGREVVDAVADGKRAALAIAAQFV